MMLYLTKGKMKNDFITHVQALNKYKYGLKNYICCVYI